MLKKLSIIFPLFLLSLCIVPSQAYAAHEVITITDWQQNGSTINISNSFQSFSSPSGNGSRIEKVSNGQNMGNINTCWGATNTTLTLNCGINITQAGYYRIVSVNGHGTTIWGQVWLNSNGDISSPPAEIIVKQNTDNLYNGLKVSAIGLLIWLIGVAAGLFISVWLVMWVIKKARAIMHL